MNGTRILGIAGLALVAGVAWGQPRVEWERTYTGLGDAECSSCLQAPLGGFTLAGSSVLPRNNQRVFMLMRIDSNGDSLWSKTIDYGFYCPPVSLFHTFDGGYGIAGSTYYGAGEADYCLMRTTNLGDTLWARTYGRGGFDYFGDAIQTSDGGFALLGSSRSADGGNYCFMLAKTDRDGREIWSHSYQRGSNDVGRCLLQTNEGGFLIAGSALSSGVGGEDFWLIRTDGQGSPIWETTFGGPANDDCYCMTQTHDGGFALAGQTSSFGVGSDVWFVRINSNGDSLWAKNYGGLDADRAYTLIETRDGGFALSGWSASFNQGESVYWLLKTDENGDSLWTGIYEHRGICYSLIQTIDGGFALTGSSDDHNIYFLKTTPDPVSVSDPGYLTPYTLHLSPPFPNPFNSSTTITYNISRPGFVRLGVYDVMGREVVTLRNSFALPGKYILRWSSNSASSGVYCIKLEGSAGRDVKVVELVR